MFRPLSFGVFVIMFTLCGKAIAGPLEAGAVAAKRGDYLTAFRLWRPVAESGDSTAQYLIGGMYDFGNGVPQDFAEAVKWYRLAAEQGKAAAQFSLGTMYAAGKGIPQNYVKADMWCILAAASLSSEDVSVQESCNNYERHMTPGQRAEARAMAVRCQTSEFKNCE